MNQNKFNVGEIVVWVYGMELPHVPHAVLKIINVFINNNKHYLYDCELICSFTDQQYDNEQLRGFNDDNLEKFDMLYFCTMRKKIDDTIHEYIKSFSS